jgi:hypothetical protein
MSAAEKAEDKNFSPPCLRRKPEDYSCTVQPAFQAFSFGTWGIFKKDEYERRCSFIVFVGSLREAGCSS